MDNPLLLLIRRLSAHAPLDEGDRTAILALPTTIRRVAPSSYIVREGEITPTCSILVDGFAYRQKLTGEGARQIVSLHIPGEPLDFQNVFLGCADHNVQALTGTTLLVIPRAAILRLVAARPGVAHAVLMNVLVEASIFREWIVNVGRRRGRTRIAHLLCEFATRMDAQGLETGTGYVLPMTQEQLGDATGLTAVHVNRMLKSLEGDGLIERDGRLIRFPDISGLQFDADFSSLYLHLDGTAPDRI